MRNDLIHFIKKHSGIILSIIASGGVIATGIFSAKVAPKAIKLLKKAEKEKNEELTTIEKIKISAPVYILPISIGLGTIFCICGSSILSARRQASLANAYGLLSSSFLKYQNKVKEIYGEEAHQEIMKAIMVDEDWEIWTPGLMEAENTSFGDDEEIRLFYDAFSKRYFESTTTKVLQAQFHLNRNYVLAGLIVSLNSWYNLLGLPPIKGGDELYFTSVDEVKFIDFLNYKVPLEDKPVEASNNYLECNVIEFVFYPVTEDEYNKMCGMY